MSSYYGSSRQNPASTTDAYSNRTSNNYSYSNSSTARSAQPMSYGTSGYSYSDPSAYATGGNINQNDQSYSTTTNYGYERNGGYDNHDSSLNDAYSQNYYGRTSQPASTRAEGLNNLASASVLDSANGRSNASRNAQSNASTSQQNRVKSPVESHTRYPNAPPTAATSYAMQQQASTSSSSSQQMAVNAAAALAGAVSRRYPAHPQGRTSSTSPNIANVRAVAQQSQRTTSPQVDYSTHSHPQYPVHHQQSNFTSGTPTGHSSNQSQQKGRESYSAMPYQAGSSQVNDLNGLSRSSAATAHVTPSRTPPSTHKRGAQQTGSIANLVTAAHEVDNTSYPSTNDAPQVNSTFVDPTAVFNPYHRERERIRQETAGKAKRKAEDEAKAEEARKQAEEAAKRKKQLEEAEAKKQQAAQKSAQSSAKKGKRKSTNADSGSKTAAAPPADEEDAMAAELKAMMEKMKAFQSKDPSLFKKLWNDMRQPGTTTAGGSSLQSPSPQITSQTLPGPTLPGPTNSTPVQATPHIPDIPASVEQPTKKRSKSAMLGPDGNKLFRNGYPVQVENNPEGLPNLGRFPTERRIRPKAYVKPRTSEGNQEQTKNPDAIDGASVATPSPATKSTPKRPSSKKAQETPTSLAGALSGAVQAANTNGASVGTTTAKQSPGTVWPLEKRNALTATALRVLKLNPENASIALSEEDLNKMLENNPSYITLCNLLESRGLKFHRGHFARELLNGVPELKTPAPPPTNGTPASSQKSATAATDQTPQHTTSSGNVGTQLPPPPQYPVPPPGYMVRWHDPPAQAGAFVPAPPVPLPAGSYGQPVMYPVNHWPRQQSSLRRTKPMGSTGRPEPAPGTKEAAARKRDFSELIDLTEMGDDDNYVVPDKHPRLSSPDSDMEIDGNPFETFRQGRGSNFVTPSGMFPPPPQPMQFNPHQSPAQVKTDEPVGENKSQRAILAKTLNKAEALKKQYYDPRTVARDILIASGRHSHERPLNVHLAGMLGKYIDLESDVSTFDWDDIDPGGPPMPKVEIVNVPATRPRYKLGQRIRTRNKLIDTVRRPEKEKRQSTIAPSPTNEPAQDTPTPQQHPQVQKVQKPSNLCHSLLASEDQATPATFDPTRAPPQIAAEELPKPSMTNTPPLKRRGRPPGSKNKHKNVGGLREQADSVTGVRINVPRPLAPRGDNFKCKWRRCSTVLHNLDTLRKHIGKVHRPSSEDVASEGYTCWWKKCEFLHQDAEGQWITTKSFPHWEVWLKHIEREHITPIALKYGDGPSTAHVDPLEIQLDREAYCADSNHNEVTPIILESNLHHLPPDTMTLLEVPPPNLSKRATSEKQIAEKEAPGHYLKAHGKRKDTKAESLEVLRALKKRKELIGPGIDRGGCTLITQEMREVFIQNEGLRKIMPGDY